MFFIGLIKLKSSNKNQEVDDNSADEQNLDTRETTKTDNEWLQEYELIYSSYSIDGY
jgi:hypothetical protein